MATEIEREMIHNLSRIANSLEEIALQARKISDPTPDELRERLEKSLAMAMFLDQKPDGTTPFN